ncbi:MAG: hypothetical protein WA705_01140 [Candidatus Ozemobacteraceae bacterium]
MSAKTSRGFALPMALLISVSLLILVGTMLFVSRSQKATHNLLEDQARALTIARGVMQLAVYKFRMLPSEFFHLQDATPVDKAFFERAWMVDFDEKVPTSAVACLKAGFQGCENLGVATFTRIVLLAPNMEYTKDVLRIVTFATVNKQKRTLEELVEIRLSGH